MRSNRSSNSSGGHKISLMTGNGVLLNFVKLLCRIIIIIRGRPRTFYEAIDFPTSTREEPRWYLAGKENGGGGRKPCYRPGLARAN